MGNLSTEERAEGTLRRRRRHGGKRKFMRFTPARPRRGRAGTSRCARPRRPGAPASSGRPAPFQPARHGRLVRHRPLRGQAREGRQAAARRLPHGLQNRSAGQGGNHACGCGGCERNAVTALDAKVVFSSNAGTISESWATTASWSWPQNSLRVQFAFSATAAGPQPSARRT